MSLIVRSLIVGVLACAMAVLSTSSAWAAFGVEEHTSKRTPA